MRSRTCHFAILLCLGIGLVWIVAAFAIGGVDARLIVILLSWLLLGAASYVYLRIPALTIVAATLNLIICVYLTERPHRLIDLRSSLHTHLLDLLILLLSIVGFPLRRTRKTAPAAV